MPPPAARSQSVIGIVFSVVHRSGQTVCKGDLDDIAKQLSDSGQSISQVIGSPDIKVMAQLVTISKFGVVGRQARSKILEIAPQLNPNSGLDSAARSAILADLDASDLQAFARLAAAVGNLSLLAAIHSLNPSHLQAENHLQMGPIECAAAFGRADVITWALDHALTPVQHNVLWWNAADLAARNHHQACLDALAPLTDLLPQGQTLLSRMRHYNIPLKADGDPINEPDPAAPTSSASHPWVST